MLNLSAPPLPDDRSKILPPLMPLHEVLRMRVRLKQNDILFPGQPFTETDLACLADDPVLKLLPEYQFSPYSMEPTSLAFLKHVFETYKPTTVVELGSGISTPMLSHHLRMLNPDVDVRYVTIDQNQDFADQTRGMLEQVGTADMTEMIVVDTKPMEIHGKETACYDIDSQQVADALHGRKADLFIIDGPVGGGPTGYRGARFATVPLLRPIAAHEALFFLDDALRDTELEIAAAWSELDYLHIFGIKAVGKGTLVGCYLDAEDTRDAA